jgi:hypothetical protein
MTALVSLDSMPGSVTGDQTRAPGSAVLEILDGLHQGVSLPLEKAVYRVGSAPDTDLVLSDVGIAGQHLILRMSPGHVAVEALGGDVSLTGADGGRLHVKQGHGLNVRLPVEIALGEARLRLRDGRPTAMTAPRPAKGVTSRHWAALAAVLLMVLCTLAFAFRAEPQALTHAPDTRRAPAAVAPPTAEQAHAWLDQALRDAELSYLHTRLDGRQISVQGSYPATLKPQWLKVQQAFDSRFGQHVVLTPAVQATATVAKPRTRFQAVWFGPSPYVIDEHGKRLYPGATLADNWVLDSIEGDEVRLTRGHERFVFTL